MQPGKAQGRHESFTVNLPNPDVRNQAWSSNELQIIQPYEVVVLVEPYVMIYSLVSTEARPDAPESEALAWGYRPVFVVP